MSRSIHRPILDFLKSEGFEFLRRNAKGHDLWTDSKITICVSSSPSVGDVIQLNNIKQLVRRLRKRKEVGYGECVAKG